MDDDDYDDDDGDDDYGDGGAMRLERSKWGCGGPSAGCYCRAHCRWGRGGRRGLCPEHQWRRTMRRCLTCSGGSARAVAEQGNVESTVGRGGKFEAELRMTKGTGGGTQGFAGWGADLDSVAAASNRTQLTTACYTVQTTQTPNRVILAEPFRTEPQNCGLTVPHATAQPLATGSYPQPRRSQHACEDGGLPSTAPVTARLRGRGVTLNRAGHTTLARTGGDPHPRRSQHDLAAVGYCYELSF
ncbi:hypothetical protein DFH27DRAFT_613419 [Peziza echinospora]|nr:hypothetical protein DFH27DRAFT_613419 [Peziza echinospora]